MIETNLSSAPLGREAAEHMIAHGGGKVQHDSQGRGLNREMVARAKKAGVQVIMLTVDSITGGSVSAINAQDSRPFPAKCTHHGEGVARTELWVRTAQAGAILSA